MLHSLTDLNRQTVWINPQAVTAIVIPSLLDATGAKSQVMVGQVCIVVSEHEANKMLTLINETPNGDHP